MCNRSAVFLYKPIILCGYVMRLGKRTSMHFNSLRKNLNPKHENFNFNDAFCFVELAVFIIFAKNIKNNRIITQKYTKYEYESIYAGCSIFDAF